MTVALREDVADAERVTQLQEQLSAERNMVAVLKESYADLESLYRDDTGWKRIGEEQTRFTSDGRDRMARLADLSVVGNAIIKRAANLRCAYVWGQGVKVSIRDDGGEGQDVNEVWDAFWNEPTNATEFTSAEALFRYERKLATRGEAFWALPTDQLTGRVFIRRVPAKEITDRICNPEDAAEVWLYKREWSAVTLKPDGSKGSEQRVAYHPALGFRPLSRPRSWGGDPIKWEAPLRAVTVNNPEDDWRGLGDLLPALPWARAHKELLEDMAVYFSSMTKIIGTITSANKRVAMNAQVAVNEAMGGPAGQWGSTDPNTSMQMMNKSSSMLDPEMHKPFATMVAAATEVPLTMLLGDPGTSGARAVAETLDQPTELMARMRQEVHTQLFRDVADYVIDSAVIAPRGPLKGTVVRDGDHLVVTLPEGDERSVQVDWPEYDSTTLKEFVDSVANATELPPLEKFKLLAKVFKLQDVDDLIEELTDDEGKWVDPEATAADAAVQAFRKGKTPVPALGDDSVAESAVGARLRESVGCSSASCRKSTEPDCTCKCNGANHGDRAPAGKQAPTLKIMSNDGEKVLKVVDKTKDPQWKDTVASIKDDTKSEDKTNDAGDTPAAYHPVGSKEADAGFAAAHTQWSSMNAAFDKKTADGSGKYDKKGNLTPHGIAIHNYTQDNSDQMNQSKRDPQGFQDDWSDGGYAEKFMAYTEAMDAYIANSLTTQDMTVSRGIRVTEGFDPGNLNPGDYFADPGYFSTSASYDQAREFADGGIGPARGTGTGGYVFVVHVPAGTPAAPGASYQEEIILGAGTRFKVISVDAETGTIYVEVVK